VQTSFSKLLAEGEGEAMTDEPDTISITVASVMVVLMVDVYRTLVSSGILTQGDAIARLEKLSTEVSGLAANAGSRSTAD